MKAGPLEWKRHDKFEVDYIRDRQLLDTCDNQTGHNLYHEQLDKFQCHAITVIVGNGLKQ